jgi:hypothetical protein
MSELTTWDEKAYGALSLESVRRLFMPTHKYRIQKHCRDPGTPFLARSAVVWSTYVISGTCIVTVQATGERYLIAAEQFLKLPLGEYTIWYPERTEVIQVLELPPQVWPKDLAQPTNPADAWRRC